MILEGVVTNVANFGAFVDIAVHQDGLVHISALSTKFVRDPREVVKAGQLVKVRVLEIDLQRQRVALTMRLSDEPGREAGGAAGSPRDAGRPDRLRTDRARTDGRGARGGAGAGSGSGGSGGAGGTGGTGGTGGASRGGGQNRSGGRSRAAPVVRTPENTTAMQAAFAALKKR